MPTQQVIVGRVRATLYIVLLLAWAPDAFARGNGSTRFLLSSGIGFSPSPQQYEQTVQLPSLSFNVSGGAIIKAAEPVLGLLDFNYFRFGQGQALVGSTDVAPTVGSSSMMTAMVGLELDGAASPRHVPFLLGSMGVGRVVLGDLESNSRYGSSTFRGKRLVAPAYAIGVGLRTGALTTGPQASISLRWVGILTDSDYTNVIPLTIGIAF